MNTNLDNAKDNDAELARWREQALQEDATANALRDKVASLTSLVKELADVRELYVCNGPCERCADYYAHPECKERHDYKRSLIARAREVLNG